AAPGGQRACCWAGAPSLWPRDCCILTVVDDPFDFQALRVHQPGRFLPNRASYEIFNEQRQLLAIATETGAHTRINFPSKPLPDPPRAAAPRATTRRAAGLTSPRRGPHAAPPPPEGGGAAPPPPPPTTRHYTLIDGQGETVGKVVGDLALKHFIVTGAQGAEF